MGKRIALIAAVCAGVLLIACIAIVAYKPFIHGATSFEVPKSCGPDVIATGAQSNSLTSQWESDVLVVRISEILYCSDSLRQISAQVIGPIVLLHIEYYSPRPPTACTCERKAIVRMSSLAQRDYKVVPINTTTEIDTADAYRLMQRNGR